MNGTRIVLVFSALLTTIALFACSTGSVSSSAISSSENSSSASIWNEGVSYGTMTDSRDSRTYKTVAIGTQTWMAQNLAYTTTTGNSWCYDSIASDCSTFGRMYSWPAAVVACPGGWHLPDTAEWNTLETYAGGDSVAGGKLKAASSWGGGGAGTNDYGFTALPAGYYSESQSIISPVGANYYTYWWTATQQDTVISDSRGLSYQNAKVILNAFDTAYGASVRCIKD